MQICDHRSVGSRMLLYASRLYASQADASQDYSTLRRSINVLVVNLVYAGDGDDSLSCYRFQDIIRDMSADELEWAEALQREKEFFERNQMYRDGIFDGRMKWVRSILAMMRSLHMTPSQTMGVFEIPDDIRPELMTAI